MRRRIRLGSLAFALAALAAPVSAQQVFEGTLAETDPPLPGHEERVADSYTVDAESGQFITVSLRSGEFDTFLRVTSPSGVERENDDSGMGTDSEVSFVADESGTWTIYASGFGSADVGAYVVTWNVTAVGETETFTGRLSSMSPKGQPYDSTSVELETGTVILQLAHTSEAFLVLSAVAPDGRRWEGSPEPGSTTLTVPGAPAGTWTVWMAGDEGVGVENLSYTLTAIVGEGGSAEVLEGTLQEGDMQLPLGEYADRIEIEIDTPGEVFFDLSSAAFDTYLVVETAGSAPMVKRNDDAEGGSIGASAVSFTPEEVAGRTGTWTVWVTSFSAGQTGPWTLRVVR